MSQERKQQQRQKKTFMLSGANGYIGSFLSKQLLDSGHQVLALVRPSCNKQSLELLKSLGAKIIFSNEIKDIEADIFIHLLGSIAPAKGESFEQLHCDNTKHLLDICTNSNISKIVYLSTLGASPHSNSAYLRSKFQAEELIGNSGINYVIVRTGLVLGKGLSGRNSKLVQRYQKLVAEKAFIPLINKGQTKIQPIYLGDLTKALEVVSLQAEYDCKTIDLAGKEIISLRNLVEALCQQRNSHKPILCIPDSIAYPVASLLEKIQNPPLLSVDQIRTSKINGITQNNILPQLIGDNIKSLHSALETYK